MLDLGGSSSPGLIGIVRRASPNLQNIVVRQDAVREIKAEVPAGQFNGAGCGDGRPGLLR